MTPITITLPWPMRVNSPNSRTHWSLKAIAAKLAKRDGGSTLAAARAAGANPADLGADLLARWGGRVAT